MHKEREREREGEGIWRVCIFLVLAQYIEPGNSLSLAGLHSMAEPCDLKRTDQSNKSD